MVQASLVLRWGMRHEASGDVSGVASMQSKNGREAEYCRLILVTVTAQIAGNIGGPAGLLYYVAASSVPVCVAVCGGEGRPARCRRYGGAIEFQHREIAAGLRAHGGCVGGGQQFVIPRTSELRKVSHLYGTRAGL